MQEIGTWERTKTRNKTEEEMLRKHVPHSNSQTTLWKRRRDVTGARYSGLTRDISEGPKSFLWSHKVRRQEGMGKIGVTTNPDLFLISKGSNPFPFYLLIYVFCFCCCCRGHASIDSILFNILAVCCSHTFDVSTRISDSNGTGITCRGQRSNTSLHFCKDKCSI